MWTIILSLLGAGLLIIVIAAVLYESNHNKGDYGDGGGTQVGGGERIPFFTPAHEKAGMMGEKIVNYHLLPLLRQDEYLLANLLIPLRNGHKTEIDCLLISRKGIFCIETKKWIGHISGNDEDEYWYQKYDDPDRSDRQHKNPVKQNKDHCSILSRFLCNRFFVNNVVIFVNLEDGWRINSEYAFTIEQFKNAYRSLNGAAIKEYELKQIYNRLVNFVATPEQLAEHRKETKNRFN